MMMTIIISFVVAYLVATVYFNVHKDNTVDCNAEIEQAADNLNATIEASADRIIAILEDYPNTKMIYWGED